MPSPIQTLHSAGWGIGIDRDQNLHYFEPVIQSQDGPHARIVMFALCTHTPSGTVFPDEGNLPEDYLCTDCVELIALACAEEIIRDELEEDWRPF
jgi:hypothetical protein